MIHFRKVLLLAAAGVFISACSLTSAVLSDPDTADQDDVVLEQGASMETAGEDPDQEMDAPEEDNPSAGAASEEVDTACFNMFYPVNEGSSWTYQTESGGTTGTYIQSYRDVSEKAFTVVTSFEDGLVAEVGWECSEGSMISTEFVNFNMLDSDLEFNTTDYSGIWLPPEEEWAVGHEWEAEYVVEYGGEVEGFTVAASMTFHLKNSITAVEPVSVPAGEYPEAYRVDSVGVISIEEYGTETPMSYSSWFVRGVGMVRSASGDADGSYTTELIAFE